MNTNKDISLKLAFAKIGHYSIYNIVPLPVPAAADFS
jgi:hypothetical protein